MDKKQILIVDDEEINRLILDGMFEDRDTYETIEAANGQEAITQIESNHNIVLILLDILMPVLNGFAVLEYMKEHDLLDAVPVILITSETIGDSEDKAYSYGVADVIHKPFYPHIVRKRSKNIIELYQSKQNMAIRLKEQEEMLLAKQKEINEANEFMIDALSSVVESRSAETGEHTKRIKYYTRVLLNYYLKQFPETDLTEFQVDQIVRASALHDIGKIGIPDAVLNKPGRLTDEEFELMKTHTTIGCDILKKFYRKEISEFDKYCYEICRHHHERWDGRGYPDHLAGDDIPISAQVVAVADVFDALVSPRVYKKSFSPDTAFQMILNGECGQFSENILMCLRLAKEDFFQILDELDSENVS